MKPGPLLVATAFLVACGNMIYELTLAQTLATLFGNSVLRYSLTIGLYLVALGAGALWWSLKPRERPVATLFRLELGLAALGGFAPMLIFGCEIALHGVGINSAWPGLILGHLLVLTIGFVSGIEIPLLLECATANGLAAHRNRIVGMDFVGCCAGSLVFPLVLYPAVGIIAAALVASCGNLLAALFTQQLLAERPARRWQMTGVAVAAAVVAALAGTETILTEISRALF